LTGVSGRVRRSAVNVPLELTRRGLGLVAWAYFLLLALAHRSLLLQLTRALFVYLLGLLFEDFGFGFDRSDMKSVV